MVTLNKVRRDAPWKWLKAGWEDFIRAPQVSLLYGLIFVGAGLAIVVGLWAIGQTSSIPVALSGFALWPRLWPLASTRSAGPWSAVRNPASGS